MRLILVFVLSVAACGDDNKVSPDAHTGGGDAPHVDAPADAKVFMDAPGPRGPAKFALTGTGNGAYWDDPTSTLYLTDDTNDQIVKWTDADGLQPAGTLPAGSAGISLGAIVKKGGGTLLTPSLGFGTQGTIFTLTSAGTSGSITGLDPTFRRDALAQDSAGVMYEAYYVPSAVPMVQTGSVAAVTLLNGVGTETLIATNFNKVVGLIATPTTLYVSDQTQNKIFAIAIPGGAVTTLTSAVPSADQLSMLPNGDLVTGGLTGGVYRIKPDGTVSTIASGFENPRGTAYDPTMKRLFIVEHSATPGHDSLHVIPLDN